LIADWCLDNRPMLRELFISDIRTSQSSPNGIYVVAFRNCALSDEEILSLLRDDEHIQQFETKLGSIILGSRIECILCGKTIN
jgi:hypothetical protein